MPRQIVTNAVTVLADTTGNKTYALQNQGRYKVYVATGASEPDPADGAMIMFPFEHPLCVGSAKTASGERVYAWSEGGNIALQYNEIP